jgi:hypothetical protein
MAAPTAPTVTTIATEGLNKAGYVSSTPGWTALLSRASNRWMAEVKNDIWGYIKDLKMLQLTRFLTLTNGLSRYSMPTDFSTDMTQVCCFGNHRGTVTGGTSTSVNLALDEDITTGDIIGKEIVITSGTGLNSYSQVTAYDTATVSATVSPAWATTPVSGDGYMIIDTYTPLIRKPIWELDQNTYPSVQGEPEFSFETGDADYGEFYLYPTPYRSDAVPYVIKQRYYANLLTLDLAGTLMSTLYQRWESVWVQGVYAKALEDMDDNRAIAEKTAYVNMVRNLFGRERYGLEQSDMRCYVRDYD